MNRDKFTLTDIRIQMVENGGWVAFESPEPGMIRRYLCALTTKKELLDWLDDNLKYATYQHETEGEKSDK